MPKYEIDRRRVHSNKTEMGVGRVASSPFFEESTPENRHGKWQGRRIIGRDTPINGGVYLGGGVREAIVVDDETQPELAEVYRNLIEQIERFGGRYKEFALHFVYTTVQKVLPYNEVKTEGIHRQHGSLPDQKIGLRHYLNAKAGVCRHQALLAAYLLERLVNDGHLGGQVSVDRNYIEGLGGHAWARYTASWGKVFIIDVAQKYFGPLVNTPSHARWFYARPGETF